MLKWALLVLKGEESLPVVSALPEKTTRATRQWFETHSFDILPIRFYSVGFFVEGPCFSKVSVALLWPSLCALGLISRPRHSTYTLT